MSRELRDGVQTPLYSHCGHIKPGISVSTHRVGIGMPKGTSGNILPVNILSTQHIISSHNHQTSLTITIVL